MWLRGECEVDTRAARGRAAVAAPIDDRRRRPRRRSGRPRVGLLADVHGAGLCEAPAAVVRERASTRRQLLGPSAQKGSELPVL
jgi:hypothetical protein